MEYVNANQALKNIENQAILVYISSAYDSIEIAFDELSDSIIKKNFYTLYSHEYSKWTKNDIVELCQSFNISIICFPDGTKAKTKDFQKRELNYEEKLKEFPALYGKKLIYLIKRTKLTVYMNLFSKKKYIVMAKPNMDIIGLDIYIDEHANYIPAFSNSNMLRIYTAKHNIDSQYKPYLISFRQLYKKIKSLNIEYVWVNPECCEIHGKSFGIKLSKKLFKYTYESIKPEFKK